MIIMELFSLKMSELIDVLIHPTDFEYVFQML
jgi:hypothetical protein